MAHCKMRWSIRVAVLFIVSLAATEAVVTSGISDKEGPPGLVDIKNVEDLVAEASDQTQKREIPVGGLSNSYGEPIPADSYGPPLDDKHSGHLILSQAASISDSYGPPIKPDIGLPIPIYGVPADPSNHIKYPELPPDIPPPLPGGQIIKPHEIYGPPKINFGQIHHSGKHEGHKIISSQYHGPPPPLQYGPPKIQYGPPKPIHVPPKLQYGPPKIQYGPPKPVYVPPKPIYGPPKLGPPKPQYGPPPPKPHFPPPKLQYGPPKIQVAPKPQYGPPKIEYGPPKIEYGPPKLEYGPPKPEYGPPKIQFAPPKPLFLQQPHPVYGPPIAHIESTQVLKPLFPIPEDTYGPPGRPISPGEHFSQQLPSSEQIYGPPIGIHHGPPQPDPDPKPAHPGIPAPPTPPHILYDGWTPIPGLISKPPSGHLSHPQDNYGPPPPLPTGAEGSYISSLHSIGNAAGSSHGSLSATYGVPAVSYGVPLQSVDIHSIGGGSSHSSSGGFVSGGYSSVSGSEALQGIDLNSIIGTSHGDSGIGLQGSKTVFEAHYTEGSHGGTGLGSNSIASGSLLKGDDSHDSSFSVLQSVGYDLGSFAGSTSNAHSSSFNIHSSDTVNPGPRQLSHPFTSDIGLKPPSGIYGVPPGGKYGIPPPPPPHNTFKLPQPQSHLSISYGVPSGSLGGSSIYSLGINSPKRPISFREPVPEGLIENIGQAVVQKDVLGIDNSQRGLAYLPPPVQELPSKGPSVFIGDGSHNSHNTFSIQASIEPSTLHSLPAVANPINFHSGGSGQFSSSGYSSSIDSYHAPLTSISDSYGAPSDQSSISTTVEDNGVQDNVETSSSNVETNVIGTDAASLAAAIIKNCPYHKALYEAAKIVEQNSQSKTVSFEEDTNDASPSSNSIKLLPPGTTTVNFNGDQDVIVVKAEGVRAQDSQPFRALPLNSQGGSDVTSIKSISAEVNTIRDTSKVEENNQKGKSLNSLDPAFQQIQSISLEANHAQNHQYQLQHQQLANQNYILNGVHTIPVQGNLGSYTLQIQSADPLGRPTQPVDSIPHEQVLSDGLLQSILQAIEQPHQTQIIPREQPQVLQQPQVVPQNEFFDLAQAPSGLILPEGYEIVPRASIESKNKEGKKKYEGRGDQEPEDSDSEGSETKSVFIVSPQNSEKISKSFLEQFGIAARSTANEEKAPEIVTPLNIIDDNEIAVYFNNKKNDVEFDYDNTRDNDSDDDNEIPEELEEEDSTETVTEISVETSISASEDESQKNAQQYSEELRPTKKAKFGDKIVKKSDPKSEEKSS